jgi:hypothetical protein
LSNWISLYTPEAGPSSSGKAAGTCFPRRRHCLAGCRRQRAQTRYEDQTSGESWGMSIRLYTPAQFRRLVEQAGLVVGAMYGSIKGERYVRGSRRIIVVAHKPPQPAGADGTCVTHAASR